MEEVFASETSYSLYICSLCSERGDMRFCMYETFCHVPANSGLFEMPDSKSNNNKEKVKKEKQHTPQNQQTLETAKAALQMGSSLCHKSVNMFGIQEIKSF